MLERVEKLEEFAKDAQSRLAHIEGQLDGIARNFVKKADLHDFSADIHKEFSAATWKIIGVCAALVAVTFWIARYVAPM